MTARQKERKVFLALIVGIVLLFLFDKCVSDNDLNLPGENIILHTIDTVLIKGKSDTISFTDTIVTQIVKYKYIDTTEHNTSLRIYTSEVEDSLISGTIYTKLELSSCNIIDQNIKYIAKFPKFITRVDTIKIKEKIVKEQVPNKVFIGVEAGGNLNMFSIGPKISLKTKKDILYGYRYDMLQNTHNIGVSFKLINPFKK
tara:strand:- start:285 stop:884 length:600 start_codon:yes stop_codon:yes gene_type:complete